MSSLDRSASCFASLARTSPVHLWDAYDASLRASYVPKDHLDQLPKCYCVEFTPTGEQIYVGARGCVYFFDLSRPGESVQQVSLSEDFDCNRPGIVSCVAFDASDPDLFALGTYDGRVVIGASNVDKDVQVIEVPKRRGVTFARFDRQSRYLFVSCRMSSSLDCFDIRYHIKPLCQLRRSALTNQRVQFDITADNCWLASGDQFGAIRLWDVNAAVSSEQVPEVTTSFTAHHDEMVNGVGFHPTWPLLASCSGQRRDFSSRLPNTSDTSDSESETSLIERNELILWYTGDTEGGPCS